MTKIDTNIAALKSLHHLQRNEEDYSKAVERLSSGKRINNAGDEVAGVSIVNRMTAQISGMKWLCAMQQMRFQWLRSPKVQWTKCPISCNACEN